MNKEEIEQLKNITQELFEKQYNSIKDLSNSELRKVIENSNWNFILQIIRHLENEIFILQEQNKILNDQLDRELIKRARLEDRIKKATKYAHETLGFLENCFGGDVKEIRACIDIHRRYLEILEEKNEEKEC